MAILRTKKIALLNAEGHAEYLLGISEDIAERKRAEAQIARLAHYDPLTDLPNRVLFQKSLSEALARRARKGDALAVHFVDLDRFKTVNDTLGTLLKYQDDIEKIKGSEAANLLNQVKADLASRQ